MARISYGYTHECAGDLGYVHDDRLITMLFHRNDVYSVHDIVKGGFPTPCPSLADALNTMHQIVAKHCAPL